MPLYIEQRIDQLEQHAIHDGKLLETVASGLANLTVQVQKNHAQFLQFREEVNQRFDAVDQRFDAVDQRFDAVDQRFDGIDKRIDGIDRRIDEFRVEMKEELSSIKTMLTLTVRLLEEKLK
jgi:archaellum component FlaC